MTATAQARVERRPRSVSLAVLLLVVVQLATIPFVFAPGASDIPLAGLVFGFVTAALSLVGAWGMWHLRRWGAILAFVFTLLNVVSSIPGFIDPPSGWILAELVVLTPLAITALVLIVLPSARRAYR